ncbi:hypothetical protein QBC34DRAFT_472243 [Podospora aff. communis PSN243]|uniref:Uncharacterized protein n=1 Tax=Podospora aff. communis PSN243 TaxID=3040156 RepID=A0AAV9GBV2_9PEZI|nr:hypothetical protein QBC34DRAFT_472243 [Podospora aff. communis PSN243]
MAESIPQLGELVRFAELAWRIYEIGWSGDFDAVDLQYRAFGQDVRHLATSLRQLENTINHARNQFNYYGEAPPAKLGWDHGSLAEIIGNYSATLRDCERLLQENESYNTTTGVGRNLRWNALVQPRVDALRQRILLHNSKVDHVLQPFEIDMTLRIHRALSRKLDAIQRQMNHVQYDIQIIRDNVQALLRAFDPSLIPTPDGPEEDEIYVVHITDTVEEALEALYWSHPGHSEGGFFVPPLRDIADAFIRCLEGSTKLFDPNDFNREPPEAQYLNLLACQFLMAKMLDSEEYHNSSQLSHWPSYVRNLQRQLSNQCLRLHEQMVVPDVAHFEAPLPPIWPREETPPYINSVESSTPMDLLVEMELAPEVEGRWQKIKLFRARDSKESFRLVIAAGDQGEPATQTRLVNFDIREARLVPHYAAPGDDTPPLVLLLDDGRGHTYPLMFREIGDLCRFQQALTGYRVVDNYMRRQLQVISVMGDGQKVFEESTLQLWRPMPINGDAVISDGSSESGGSSRRASSSGRSTGLGNSFDDYVDTSSVANGNIPQRSESSGSDYINAQIGHAPSLNGHTAQRRASTNSHGGASQSNGYTNTQRSPTPLRQTPFGRPNGNRNGPNIPHRTSSQSASSSSGSSNISTQQPSTTTTQSRHNSYYHSPPTSSQGPLPTVRENGTPFDPFNVHSPSFTPIPPPRRPSSTTTTTTQTTQTTPSILSTTSHTSQLTVSISSRANTAPTGTLHTHPPPPLLVLFTRKTDPTTRQVTSSRIIAIPLDSETNVNHSICKCTSNPKCQISCIERKGGSLLKGVIKIDRMDLLPLAEARKRGRGGLVVRDVMRVSICFGHASADPQMVNKWVGWRREFSGWPCRCSRNTVGEKQQCLREGHGGKLGWVTEKHRRDLVEWNKARHGCHIKDVVGIGDD